MHLYQLTVKKKKDADQRELHLSKNNNNCRTAV